MTSNTQLPNADAGRLDRGVSRPAPERVQLSRAKGWKMPPNTVKVDRTTKWGNPFRVGETNPYGTVTKDARHSWQIYLGFAPQNELLVTMARAELRGKNLACWCKRPGPYEDDACHAAVLLKLANSEPANVGAKLETTAPHRTDRSMTAQMGAVVSQLERRVRPAARNQENA